MLRHVRRGSLAMISLAVAAISAPHAQGLCVGNAVPLFACETERPGKFIAICAVEEIPGQRWSSPQYRFGIPEDPEMVYPTQNDKGGDLYFSHERNDKGYRVSIRFKRGGYTYRVYSDSGKEESGVIVTAASKVTARIRCIERPLIFPAYLRAALPCDEDNPYGKRACQAEPYPLSDGRNSWR